MYCVNQPQNWTFVFVTTYLELGWDKCLQLFKGLLFWDLAVLTFSIAIC